MSDEVKSGPVDNSHQDAGIAAREIKPEPKKETATEGKPTEVKVTVEVEDDDTQNDAGESATSGNDEPAKPRNKGVGKRIDELTKARYDAERERDYWKEQAMRTSADPKPAEQKPAAPAAADVDAEPTFESCDFDQEKYQRDWYEWRRKQDQKTEAMESKRRAFAEKETAFRAEHPDYDALVRDPNLPISEQMAAVIFEADNPPAIAYYLAQHPDESAAIAAMTPAQIGRAIGRIEAKLDAPPPVVPPPVQPEPKTVTKAPAPVTTLTGAPAVKKSPDEMSMAEYDAHRRQERAAKGLAP